MLLQCNPYVKVYEQARVLLANNPFTDLSIRIKCDLPDLDLRRYNKPTCDDVAAIIPLQANDAGMDIIVSKKGGHLRRIKDFEPVYEPLHFVLMFPRGETGWGLQTKDVNGNKVTLREFAMYRLSVSGSFLYRSLCVKYTFVCL